VLALLLGCPALGDPPLGGRDPPTAVLFILGLSSQAAYLFWQLAPLQFTVLGRADPKPPPDVQGVGTLHWRSEVANSGYKQL